MAREYNPKRTKAAKSILLQQKRRRARKLDISGARGRAYRKRHLSLITKARIAAGLRRYWKFRKTRKDTLKRRS
jgi:hypothetical protein